jgi:hypothetical protein
MPSAIWISPAAGDRRLEPFSVRSAASTIRPAKSSAISGVLAELEPMQYERTSGSWRGTSASPGRPLARRSAGGRERRIGPPLYLSHHHGSLVLEGFRVLEGVSNSRTMVTDPDGNRLDVGQPRGWRRPVSGCSDAAIRPSRPWCTADRRAPRGAGLGTGRRSRTRLLAGCARRAGTEDHPGRP